VSGVWPTQTLADACQIKPPKSEARRHLAATDLVSFAPMEDLGINQKLLMPKGTRALADVADSYTYFADGDVLLAKITPCFENGKLGIAANLTNGIGFGSSEYIVFRPNSALDKHWLYYFLCRETFREEGAARMSGAVGHKRVAKEFIDAYPIPVPPLPEQQRIVRILDEAFDGIATAKANAEKNLQNARALFESHLQSVFTQPAQKHEDQERSVRSATKLMAAQEASGGRNLNVDADVDRINAGRATKTGGREATIRHIPGEYALAVGMPVKGTRPGWQWVALSSLARLESGHTPSRSHPEYWGGSVRWIGIQDAREHHGRRIDDTFQKTNELGIANSSARVLPADTVCLSRTASVGYIVVMGRPMATSQDFVNWVCTRSLVPDFLKYLLLAEGRQGLLRYASGSVHQTIYFPEAKAFHICCPGVDEQLRIVVQCDALREETQRLESLYQRKLTALDELKKSLLHQAFSGVL
jgi:restriction endonuclease S subunit